MAAHRKVPVGERADISAVLETSTRLVATCRVTYAASAVVIARSKALARRRGDITPG